MGFCCIGIWYSLSAPLPDPARLDPSIGLFIPKVSAQMVQYSRLRYAIHFGWVVLETAFLCAFLQFGWAGELRDFVSAKSNSLFIRIALFVLIFSLLTAFVLSPFSYATGFWLKHHFGLSNQSLVDWLGDWAKAFAINLCIEIPVWWLIYKALTKFRKSWPYLVFAGSVPVILALTFVAPLLIDPVFNKIEPMPASSLRSGIEKLAAAAGIPNAPIFTADRHKQTNEINAYVTGLGPSARIVIWDTTLQRLPEDQTLSVVAHELGHYVLKHVYWGCAIAVAISLSLLPVNIFLAPLVFEKLPRAWKVGQIGDFAGIPFLMLCSMVVSFAAEPLINGYSRSVEHEADMFGFNLTHDGPAFARTFASLARENLAEPCPPKFIEFWLFSHPSLGSRISSVMQAK